MKLSIIMPCFNVGETLPRALDSILMQIVDFQYEIIIVNDASKDNTLEIANQYAQKFDHIHVISNCVNAGNARSFYNGLNIAKGDYFCVLDGDDYYTIHDKLQRQVNFLDRDIDEEYVGCCTQYIIDLGDGTVSVPARSAIKEFNYVDFLTMNAGYFHTATHMYRNIFRGNIPEYFKMSLYRGDTPRTTFHLMYSGKKIRVLDFVGSAYLFEFNGIWSSMKEKEQFRYQINFQTQHKENVPTLFEKNAADKLIAFNVNKLRTASDHVRLYPAADIETCLMHAQKLASKFAFADKEFVLQELYYSEYIDSLCASLGFVWRVNHPEHIQTSVNTENICIVNGVLNPRGGGIYAEIAQLIDVYKDKNVYLFVTNMNEIPEDSLKLVLERNNVTIVFPPEGNTEKLSFYAKKMKDISPSRAYYYCSHNDVYAQAIMHTGACENICLFSFDHGYICGISNPNIDKIVAKRPTDYYLLKKKFRDKVIYIPTWNDAAVLEDGISYEPFKDHEYLITASGAARYYKLNGCPPYQYEECILNLLKRTKGIHYHYGEIPEDVLAAYYTKLENAGISAERFVVIPWAENLPQDLLLRHVDVFIEPFPVVSYKMTLSVLSAGVPIIALDGIKRLSVADFLPESALKWRNLSDFVHKLTSITKEELVELSRDSLDYFNQMHSTETILPYLRSNQEFCIPKYVYCSDLGIRDITEYTRLFSNSFRINIMCEM